MSSTPTTRLRLEKQGTGENSGTWGTRLNGNTIDLVDEAIAGLSVVTITGNVTLTSSNFATDQARKAVLRFDGSPTVDFTVTIPGVEKTYLVHNNTAHTATITTGSGATAAIASTAVKYVYCDAVNVYEHTDSSAKSGTTPIGGTMVWWNDSLPTGFGTYAFANGQAISRSVYSDAFAVFGTAFGTGDGTTTFNLPDMRDRVPVGKGTMGGTTAAGRITQYVTNLLGNVFGECLHLLGIAELPAHTHAISASGTTSAVSNDHTHAVSGTTSGISADHSHAYSGTTSGHSNDHTHTYADSTATPNSQTQAGSGFFNVSGVADVGRTTGGSSADHTHTYSGTTGVGGTDHTHSFSVSSGGASAGHTHTWSYTGNTGSVGSGTAMNVVQPSIVCNWIIRIA